MSRTAAFLRLVRAARVFAKHDALLPPELRDQVPWSALFAAGLLRLTTFGGAGKGLGRGQRFAKALGEMGPSYVKLGQFLATRPDIVGKPLALDLTSLQDRMPPFPLAEAKRAIAEELGRPADELFDGLGEPVAAASIAQVHRARVKASDLALTGEVAIKVLRPDIENRFRRDLGVLLSRGADRREMGAVIAPPAADRLRRHAGCQCEGGDGFEA